MYFLIFRLYLIFAYKVLHKRNWIIVNSTNELQPQLNPEQFIKFFRIKLS